MRSGGCLGLKVYVHFKKKRCQTKIVHPWTGFLRNNFLDVGQNFSSRHASKTGLWQPVCRSHGAKLGEHTRQWTYHLLSCPRAKDDWERHCGRYRRSVVVITTQHTDKTPWPWRVRSVKQTRASDGLNLLKDNCNLSVVGDLAGLMAPDWPADACALGALCRTTGSHLQWIAVLEMISLPLVHVDLSMCNSEMRRETGGNQPLFKFPASSSIFQQSRCLVFQIFSFTIQRYYYGSIKLVPINHSSVFLLRNLFSFFIIQMLSFLWTYQALQPLHAHYGESTFYRLFSKVWVNTSRKPEVSDNLILQWKWLLRKPIPANSVSCDVVAVVSNSNKK